MPLYIFGGGIKYIKQYIKNINKVLYKKISVFKIMTLLSLG